MLVGLASIAAVVLAITFAMSALAKLRDRRGAVEGFTALGLPVPTALLVVLVTVELALVVALLVRPGWAALAAIVVLAGFTVVLNELRQRGNAAPCHCFGARVHTRVGAAELIRNGVLVAVAAPATQTDRLVRPTAGAWVVALSLVVIGAALWHRAARPSEPVVTG